LIDSVDITNYALSKRSRHGSQHTMNIEQGEGSLQSASCPGHAEGSWAEPTSPGAFLAAAVWGGHICIWGGARIPDDI